MSKEAEADMLSAGSVHSRFEEHWRGVEWLLARTPEIGIPGFDSSPQESLLFVSAGIEQASTKDIWILYSYDDQFVDVKAINVKAHES